MSLPRFAVKSVIREHPIQIVRPEDFELEPIGEIEPQTVLNDPSITLYCLDPDKGAAIFVKSKDQAAVDTAPFYYQAQVAQAVEVISMPSPMFHQLAEEIEPKELIFIHSVGRCGSTLISKVLDAIPGIHSLSEPDELTQITKLRKRDGSNDEWMRQVILSSSRWRCKSGRKPDIKKVAIKTRSEVLVLADLIAECFPNEKHFFLYRDGLAWMRSVFAGYPLDRELYNAEMNLEMQKSWAGTIPLVNEFLQAGKMLNPVQTRVSSWIACMEEYFTLLKIGVPLAAGRFEDLTTDPRAFLHQFFEFCGIQKVDWNAIEEVLGRDSQAGTIYDREVRRASRREMTPELVQDVLQLIGSRPMLRSPDVEVPLTLRLEPVSGEAR